MTRFSIVAHHSRGNRAYALARLLNAEVLLDVENQGARWNHIRALKRAAKREEPTVIVEDDAVPGVGFRRLATEWVERYPTKLVSFYLGTSVPVNEQATIPGLLAAADAVGADHLQFRRLRHGVAYSVPWHWIDSVLAELPDTGSVDADIGIAWEKLTRSSVIHTVPSLVDHLDGETVEWANVVRSGAHQLSRKAHRFVGVDPAWHEPKPQR